MTCRYYDALDSKTVAITTYDNGDIMIRILRDNCMESVATILKKDLIGWEM